MKRWAAIFILTGALVVALVELHKDTRPLPPIEVHVPDASVCKG